MTFQDAVQKALEHKKYNDLMDRGFDINRFIQNLINKIIEWLSNKIHIKPSALPKYNTDYFKNTLIIISIVLVVVLAWFLYKQLKQRKKQSQSMNEIFTQLHSNKLSFSDLLQMSQDFAQAGDFREGIRHQYIALLWALHCKNMIYLHESKTNNQLKREVATRCPSIASSFSQAVEVFQYTWFGHRPVGLKTYQTYTQQVKQMVEEVQNEK